MPNRRWFWVGQTEPDTEFKTKLIIKYSAQVFSVWSDVGEKVNDYLGSNSGVMWGGEERYLCIWHSIAVE